MLRDLQQASSAAVEGLKEIIEDKRAPSSSRVIAARTVLEIGLKAVEVEDLEARIAAIEQYMGKTDGASPIRKAM
jgi:hypothetical protein